MAVVVTAPILVPLTNTPRVRAPEGEVSLKLNVWLPPVEFTSHVRLAPPPPSTY
jgi:hypothetical protein